MENKTASDCSAETYNKLKKAHLTAKLLNYISVAIVVWICKFPKPYEYVLIASLAMPIVGIIVIRYWKGLIKIELKRNSINPNLLPVFLPGIIYACRVKFDFCINEYSNVWLLVGILTLAFSTFFLVNKRFLEIDNTYQGMLRILIFSFVYSYGAVIGINCAFDKSKPEIFKSVVHYKRVNNVGVKSYEIEVSSWKKDSKIQKLSIDKALYDQLPVGGNVSIYVFKGIFNIPWVEADYAQ